MKDQEKNLILDVDKAAPARSTDRMESLDGLRGVAALIVVFAHAMLTQPFFWTLHFGPHTAPRTAIENWIADTPFRLLWSGSAPVILFFVLSGFVLTLPWTNGRQLSYGNYVISRICRIYLPYLAAMIFAAVFAALLGGVRIPTATDWINIYAWISGFKATSIPVYLSSIGLMLGNDYSTWLNNPTWSLVWEMRVSLLFPLIVIPVIRWGLAGAVVVVFGLWLGLGFGKIGAASFPEITALLGRPHMTFYYAAFFLMGAVLAKYRAPLTQLVSRGNGEGPILLLVAGLWSWYTQWAVQQELMIGAGAMLIIIASISDGLPRKFLLTTPIQWLGRVSYSLYLVHVPIILIAVHLLHDVVPYSFIALIAILAALIFSELFYRAIERPTHKLGRYLARSKTPTDNIGTARTTAI
jgi:peptidoglycan/LPS O-acetylase OafA/YrhL